MQPIKANELCKGLGTWKPDRMVATVATDSRNVKENSLFVCIAGEKTDGHRYAAQAMAQGAAGILAQHPVEGVNPEDTLLISDPLDAMIAMGANYRAQFQPLVVGVTGSVGKTTTKEFCYAVFSAFGNTVKTLGNQNNEIGMPNTLFRFNKDTQYAVIEMGMQGLGEIHKLTMAARPAGAIITMIGQSHLEQLGTRENILRAKMEICDGLPQGAPLVINADNDLLANAQVPAHVRRVTFAIHDSAADVRAEHIQRKRTERRLLFPTRNMALLKCLFRRLVTIMLWMPSALLRWPLGWVWTRRRRHRRFRAMKQQAAAKSSWCTTEFVC